jgi:hypothetical protein
MEHDNIERFCKEYKHGRERVISYNRSPEFTCESCHSKFPLMYSCTCGMNICPVCFDIGMLHFKSECEYRFSRLYSYINIRIAQNILGQVRHKNEYHGSLTEWWNKKGKFISNKLNNLKNENYFELRKIMDEEIK